MLKIPINLPYQNNWEDFERVDGELTVEGKIYKYVKRKIEDGNLVLLCLPDHNKMKIESAKVALLQFSNDIVPNNGKEKKDGKPTLHKSHFSDYEKIESQLPGVSINTGTISLHGDFVFNLSSSPHNSPEQPPDNGSQLAGC